MRNKQIIIVLAALLALMLIGTALAEPPTPTNPAPSPTSPVDPLGNMRDWMDRYWGQGSFDSMHSSPEGMVETCNSMMGSGGMMGGGSMMGNGARTSSQGSYGGMMGSGSWAPR
ncbi:MAG: hypothetical protein Q8P59_00120, partial [Dehalococcoidia bacterium]|nr:hypothetical protein [Dehalococcoidia bacterium]